MTTPRPKTGSAAWRGYAAILSAGLLCLPVAIVPRLSAARGNATVAASLSEATVDVGEQVQFRISITNGDADDSPHAPVVDGLTCNSTGRTTSSQYSVNNGSFSQTTTIYYLFSVETNKPGRYVIPGQEVPVDGVALRTLPVTLTVLGDSEGGGTGQNGPAFFELIVPKKTAYVGESVPIEMRASYVAGMQRDPDPNVILTGDGFSAQPFATPKIAQRVSPGSRYAVDSYKTAIAGLKIGTLSVGPASIDPMVRLPVRQGRRGFTDPFDALTGDPFDAFTNLSRPRRLHLETKPVSLEIVPLPEDGKPANFSGAIGQFKLEAEAVPVKAQTGDPVTIRLRLSGQGNFDRVAAPVLSDDKGLRIYPPTSKFKADDDVSLSGVKTFEQVVIPEGPRTSLPAYRFNYLDPATGRYVNVETPPLAVKIEGSDRATPTPAPAVVGGSSPVAATPAPTPRPAPEDIHYILAEFGRRRDAEAFRPWYRRWGFWGIQGGILAAVLAFGGMTGWRVRMRDAANQRAARLARQLTDLQLALRREDTGRREFYTAAIRLAQMRAGAAAGETNASLSAADIVRAQKLNQETAGSVQEIFDRHEELAYSGGPAAETPVPADERRGVLHTLENIGRPGPA